MKLRKAVSRLWHKLWGRPRSAGFRFSGDNWPVSWWQTDRGAPRPAEFGPVFACVQILAQEIAKLPIRHMRINPDGSRALRVNTVPSRVLREPTFL